SGLDRAALREEACEQFGLDPKLPTLLVFGGSQGARSLNNAVSATSTPLGDAGIQVLHVIGARNTLENVPVATKTAYVTLDYVSDMDRAYAAADLALCRAGALTCAELAAVGLPALYVPLPWGNGEQRRNALPVTQAGGGILVEDAELTSAWLTENVIGLLGDAERLAKMSQAAAGYGRRDGDEALRAMVYRALGGNTLPRRDVTTGDAPPA
ncbi:MAG: UDP-N-acetylglucosamine--N-acetylmuramyl-(pentapeptide) pyrophosphoryl-undecaprenol N-acetylglucosamine transferase, partial [Pseudonocardiaceae bacterium]